MQHIVFPTAPEIPGFICTKSNISSNVQKNCLGLFLNNLFFSIFLFLFINFLISLLFASIFSFLTAQLPYETRSSVFYISSLIFLDLSFTHKHLPDHHSLNNSCTHTSVTTQTLNYKFQLFYKLDKRIHN